MDFKERKDFPMCHLFELGELNVYDTKVINLSAGTPSEALLKNCNSLFKEATDHRLKIELEENSSFIFQYGPTLGTFEFRKKLAEFLSKGYQSFVHPADIVLTAGATNGLLLILSSLIDLNGYVFLDDVTYMIALETIQQFSTVKVIPVKLNDDGVDINDLESKLQQNQFQSKDKMFWAIYYTIPTFHNPTGISFSDEVNTSLVKLARKYDILIACDDVYNLLTYDDNIPPKRLYAYDEFEAHDFKGNVISNGTFSKILAPGVRVGWMECPPRIVDKFRNSGVLTSGGAINHYSSGIITSLIELGLAEQQLKACLGNYKEQRDALFDSLDRFLPDGCSYIKPKGGYFIWIKLPVNCDGDALCQHLQNKYKVFAICGKRFSIKNEFRNFLRLSFAFHPSELLREAGVKLCAGIDNYLYGNK